MRCLSLMKLLQARDMAPALTPINGNMAVRINPNSFAFTLLLGLLASLPTFGIDMILPSLSAAAADLGVTSADVGLAMSVYLMTMGASLLIYGPVSDRFGRKPIIMFGCALVVAASLGCLLSSSLSQLLVFRALQGAGASATGIAAVAIVNDLFEGETAAARMANVVLAIYVVPMIAPIVGAALLALGSWRTVYLVPLAAGLVLLAAMSAFSERDNRSEPQARPCDDAAKLSSRSAASTLCGLHPLQRRGRRSRIRLRYRFITILHQCSGAQPVSIWCDLRSQFAIGHARYPR